MKPPHHHYKQTMHSSFVVYHLVCVCVCVCVRSRARRICFDCASVVCYVEGYEPQFGETAEKQYIVIIVVWLLHDRYHVKLLPSWSTFCIHYTTMHQYTVSFHSKRHA